MIPTGEMPRTILITCDRYLTDKVTPGNRVKVTGIMSILNKVGNNSGNASKEVSSKVRQSYIRVVGMQSEIFSGTGSTQFALPHITQAEEDRIVAMSKDPLIYDKLCKSVASAIYGQDEIKKAVCCLLFSGSPKVLPDGMRLRGDINVLLLGDPSTAKSQFLKFVERAAPISVYTSGKGSSAAGLTASIIKDNSSGEF